MMIVYQLICHCILISQQLEAMFVNLMRRDVDDLVVVPVDATHLPDFVCRITVVNGGRISNPLWVFGLMFLCCREKIYILKALLADFKKFDSTISFTLASVIECLYH